MQMPAIVSSHNDCFINPGGQLLNFHNSSPPNGNSYGNEVFNRGCRAGDKNQRDARG